VQIARTKILQNYSNVTFDFLDLYANKFYPISLRIVRFKIADDSYETVITNLNQSDFSPGELKELYKKRWGIGVSRQGCRDPVGESPARVTGQSLAA